MENVVCGVRMLLIGLTCLASGCTTREYTASGHASIVKISSDSKRILYQDSRYARVYLYHVDMARMETFKGGIGCASSGVKSFVLLPWCLNDFSLSRVPIACFLATVENGATILTMVENLPPGHLLSLSFCSDQSALQAEICQLDGPTRLQGRRTLVNRLDGQGWSVSQSSCTVQTRREQMGRPVGIMDEGYVYYPYSDSLGSVSDGRNTERFSSPERQVVEVRLRSPDGKSLIRINDWDDPLYRLTLTDLTTNKKVVLLDKDDTERDAQEERERELQYPLVRLLLFFHGMSGS